MKAKLTFFHCGDQLQKTLINEINEVKSVVSMVQWACSFQHKGNEDTYEHQTAYNKAFATQFTRLGWEPQPLLRVDPKLIGDFRKGLVFVEIQFGNSSTLYRDYYKFQYGLINGLLSLAVLVVPTKPSDFFPTRQKSVLNMAEYDLAHTCLTVLPINVLVLLVGCCRKTEHPTRQSSRPLKAAADFSRYAKIQSDRSHLYTKPMEGIMPNSEKARFPREVIFFCADCNRDFGRQGKKT